MVDTTLNVPLNKTSNYQLLCFRVSIFCGLSKTNQIGIIIFQIIISLTDFDSNFVFDLLIRDKDLELARHITFVHTHSKHPPTQVTALDMGLMRKYISLCKMKDPNIPEELTDFIVCKCTHNSNKRKRWIL